MKQLSLIGVLSIALCTPLLFVCSATNAFDINSQVGVEGDINVNMNMEQGSAIGDGAYRLNQYQSKLRGFDGATSVSHVYTPETGQTGVDIGYAVGNNGRLIQGLSAKEKIGVDTVSDDGCRFGAAGSGFYVEELSSSSTGDFNQGTYGLTAGGVGRFSIGVKETARASDDPIARENNEYYVRGDGVFSISGQYGFLSGGAPGAGAGAAGGGVGAGFDAGLDAGLDAGFDASFGGPLHQTLCGFAQ